MRHGTCDLPGSPRGIRTPAAGSDETFAATGILPLDDRTVVSYWRARRRIADKRRGVKPCRFTPRSGGLSAAVTSRSQASPRGVSTRILDTIGGLTLEPWAGPERRAYRTR